MGIGGDVGGKNMRWMVGGIENRVCNMGGVVGGMITGLMVGGRGCLVGGVVFWGGLMIIGILNYVLVLGKVKEIEV